MDPALITALAGILLAGLLLLVVTKTSFPLAHYLYANAIIQSRSKTALTDKKLRELADCKNILDIKNSLSGTDYQKELEHINMDISSIHSAIEKSYFETISSVLDLCPEKLKPLINTYIMFIEARIIKMIYRSKVLETNIDKNLLTKIGNIDSTLIEKLVTSRSAHEFSAIMRKTPYENFFDHDFKNLEQFEIEFENWILKNLVSISKQKKIYNHKAVFDLITYKLDILNIQSLIKFNLRKISKEKRKNLLINIGFTWEKADKLISAENTSELISNFKNTHYFVPLKTALELYEKDKVFSHFDTQLLKEFKKYLKNTELQHSLGPISIITYLIKKEIEVRNLFMITKLVNDSVNTEKIKNRII